MMRALAFAWLLSASCSGDPAPQDPAPAPPVAEPAGRTGDEPPDIVVIVVDTLRRDRLGTYGDTTATTPAIDRLAEDGIRYDGAVSTAPWTTPSVASLLTSRMPSQLGILTGRTQLPDDATLLSELLGPAGYATAGVISHTYCGSRWNFDQGFDVFDESGVGPPKAATGATVTDRALAILAEHPEPLFLFVHYFDPHFPYIEHPGLTAPRSADYAGPIHAGMRIVRMRKLASRLTDADRAELDRLYAGEVRYTDQQIDRLLRGLREAKRYDDALIVLTHDHGEALGDHGRIGHTGRLYGELVAAPLIVKYPGGQPRGADPRPASLLDVVPTVAAALDLELPPGALGHPLSGPAPADDRLLLSETSKGARLRAVSGLGHRLIRDDERGRTELYDLVADPSETTDLADAPGSAELRAHLEGQLSAWPQPEHAGASADIDEAERERLRALGYLDE